MWSQTPQFTLILENLLGSTIEINVHHGIIKTLEAKAGQNSGDVFEELRAALVGQRLQDIGDWGQFLQSRIEPWHNAYEVIADRLETLLPVPQFDRH